MALHGQESLGTRLTADVNDVVRVGEAIELSGGALGVSTHILEVEPVADIENLLEAAALADAINAITGGTPDGVLNARVGGALVGSRLVEEGLAVGAQDLRNRMLVVEHDAGEVAIHAIVDIDHVAGAVKGSILNGATGDDVAGDGKSRRDVVSTGLSNDFDVVAGGEEVIESRVQSTSHVLERLARKAAANIQGTQVEAVVASLLEDGMSVTDSLVEGDGIGSARANVEANTDNVQAEFLGKGQEVIGGVHGCTKLHAEAAETGRVVGHDAQEEFGAGEELGNLVKLIGVVEGHLLDACRLDIADVGVGLAGLGIDDAVGAGTHGENLFNLALGGAVEAGAQLGEQAEDLGVGVALDGVEGANAREILLPAEVLAVDFAKISNKEGVFVAGIAHFVVDGLNALVKSFSNQLFCDSRAIMMGKI